MNRISVCVPTYNRPKTTMQLVCSFLNQGYPDKELIISDDSTNDDIERIMNIYAEPSIRYYKNQETLGYSANLLQALRLATGDVIVILGDDDVFIRQDALEKYASVFRQDKDIVYAYSNLIQFTDSLRVEYQYTLVSADRQFRRGDPAMAAMWTTAIFIAGIGLRNGPDLGSFYGDTNLLFPQVKLVGELLNQGDAYAIGDYLIGARAHEDQLGFHALKGERIKGNEQHATIELFAILEDLKNKYELTYDQDALADQLLDRYWLMMFKEKSIAGNAAVHDYYTTFRLQSRVARDSKKFTAVHALAMILPSWVIRLTRGAMARAIRIKRHETFSAYEQQLSEIVRI